MQLVEIYPKTTFSWSPFWRTLYFWRVRVRCQIYNWVQHSHQYSLSHLKNHRDKTQQHHHNHYPLLNCIKRQHHIQQRGKRASQSPHHLAIFRTPTPSLTTQDVHTTLPIILRYCPGYRRFDIKKHKAPILLDKKDIPKIPHNAGSRRQAREGALVTGWMNNRKRGAPLKITQFLVCYFFFFTTVIIQ